MDESSKAASRYLKAPYSRLLIYDEENEGYAAEILEFPGCFAEGDTLEEAHKNLDSAAQGWIQAVLDGGQEVPEPSASYDYSGRVLLRLPRGLHRRALLMAKREGTSLNTFLVATIAERVGHSKGGSR